MKCLILAAGYATRLYPLTENFPKPLLEVRGKTILDWLIEDIGDAADEFIVISNHKFVSFFEEWAGKRPEPITVLDDGTDTNETRLGAVCDILFASVGTLAGGEGRQYAICETDGMLRMLAYEDNRLVGVNILATGHSEKSTAALDRELGAYRREVFNSYLQ